MGESIWRPPLFVHSNNHNKHRYVQAKLSYVESCDGLFHAQDNVHQILGASYVNVKQPTPRDKPRSKQNITIPFFSEGFLAQGNKYYFLIQCNSIIISQRSITEFDSIKDSKGGTDKKIQMRNSWEKARGGIERRTLGQSTDVQIRETLFQILVMCMVTQTGMCDVIDTL